MFTVALSLTYLGVVCCYVASPATRPGGRMDGGLRGGARLGGLVLLGAGLGLSMTAGPGAAGLLVWLAMGMAALSVLVIAAPLARWVVPGTSMLALAAAVGTPWI